MPRTKGKISERYQKSGWRYFWPEDVQQFPDTKGGPLFPTTISDPNHPNPEDGFIDLEPYADSTYIELDFSSYKEGGGGVANGVETGLKSLWWIMGVDPTSIKSG